MADSSRDDALEYHSGGRPGKTEVVPTKPTATQRDLALAYTPGVAKPCLEIAKNPGDIYKYTNRGNLVAVITISTAPRSSRRPRCRTHWKSPAKKSARCGSSSAEPVLPRWPACGCTSRWDCAKRT